MEQRASPRFRLNQAIRLSVDGDDEEEYLSAEILDLSAEGIGILSDSPVPVSSPMFLMFGLQEQCPTLGLVRCEGYATRTEVVGDKYLIGVKFTSMDSGSDEALRSCLDSLQAGS
ncbi:MAG TPA: PilZ domain-containing protein [Rectinemataceae bacterium]|nr:PilZ domain-containing protein [Rectinemataceae bacterium]